MYVCLGFRVYVSVECVCDGVSVCGGVYEKVSGYESVSKGLGQQSCMDCV